MNTKLKVHIIPILKDNYAYVLSDPTTSDCIVVDPGEARPIQHYVDLHSLQIKQIWITHFHNDHIAGLKELKENNHCKVFGSAKEQEKIGYIDQTVSDLDLLHFHHHPFKVFELPGHTLGHVGYWLFNEKYFFSGDTLFSLGCGYLFEGEPKQMWNSLCKIRSLPEDTLIFAGHEYTQENAKFALSIDPANTHLQAYAELVNQKRAAHEPTMPMILKTEMFTNPFLRADLPYWKERFDMLEATDLEIFQKIREMKNKFKKETSML